MKVWVVSEDLTDPGAGLGEPEAAFSSELLADEWIANQVHQQPPPGLDPQAHQWFVSRFSTRVYEKTVVELDPLELEPKEEG